jgi:putative RecB family exonuclease
MAELAFGGDPRRARSRLVIVPTRAAASLLVASTERQHVGDSPAVVHPDFTTARDLPARLAARTMPTLPPVRQEAREILMGMAGRQAIADGHPPPFDLRPGLIAEMVTFYDAIRRRRRDVGTFERLALGRLEPGAEHDRGARRLVRQTRFLAAAFRSFESLSAEHRLHDEHACRALALTSEAVDPWLHIVVAVGDDARDPHGLSEADWDLLTRVPALERLDVVVTDRCLAGAWHERVHELLPGLVEVHWTTVTTGVPVLRVPVPETLEGPATERGRRLFGVARDREDEVADFARWVRLLRRRDPAFELERAALVVGRPLPYVYLARAVMQSANVASQAFDTLPLAAEPFAAALDLVFSVITARTSRAAGVALLRSPHFQWFDDGASLSPESVSAADRFLGEVGYLGGSAALQDAVGRADPSRLMSRHARSALNVLIDVALWADAFVEERPAHEHLNRVIEFVLAHAPRQEDPSPRQRRARTAIMRLLATLRDEYGLFDRQDVPIERVMAVVRRWIDAHTFAPRRTGDGCYVVDSDSARFGDFEHVQLAGLVEGEWPVARAKNIFYGASILGDLGWPQGSERTDYARACFADLLSLPLTSVTASTFELEDDALVTPSVLLDELERCGLEVSVDRVVATRVLDVEALGQEPVTSEGLGPAIQAQVRRRLNQLPRSDSRYHGSVDGHPVRAYSLSGLERYEDCPFLFFARDVLRLPELVQDDRSLSPRARGQFVHEVCERFFEAWDRPHPRPVTPEALDEARALFLSTAEPLLSALRPSDAALERARLFGSAMAVGVVDVLLNLEATAQGPVVDRWLERRFEGRFSLGAADGVALPIRGIADRIDLLEGRRLRVIDYKSGQAPAPARALQVPVYALCAMEVLHARDGFEWHLEDAMYVSFSGRRPLTPIAVPGDDVETMLRGVRERVVALTGGIEGGNFPPRPHDTARCRTCAYSDVCRKDYVHG